jgi:hypothetical protein
MNKSIQLNKDNDRINIFKDGGMVTGEFEIDGQLINPFYAHPWREDEVEQGLLKFLKGDFVCVPFGITPETPADGYMTDKPLKKEYAHGYSSNATWVCLSIQKFSKRSPKSLAVDSTNILEI